MVLAVPTLIELILDFFVAIYASPGVLQYSLPQRDGMISALVLSNSFACRAEVENM